MSKTLTDAETMHSLMEDAISSDAGNGTVDCLVHFARMVEGRESVDDVQGILDVDLDDCTPAYAKAFRKTWGRLETMLDKVLEDQA